MRLSLRSTSTRVLLELPSVVLIEQAIARRPLHPRWLPILAWGYAQYRLAGSYRLPRAGGPAGMSQGFPDEIVESGIYRYTRNPMYLGHLIFATGLTLGTRSPVAACVMVALVPWFRGRVRHDERRLVDRFGDSYAAYTTRVPRWLPGTRPSAACTSRGN
jgi:protein-S-isoprenylcysteine O-methyltransferase Ste14